MGKNKKKREVNGWIIFFNIMTPVLGAVASILIGIFYETLVGIAFALLTCSFEFVQISIQSILKKSKEEQKDQISEISNKSLLAIKVLEAKIEIGKYNTSTIKKEVCEVLNKLFIEYYGSCFENLKTFAQNLNEGKDINSIPVKLFTDCEREILRTSHISEVVATHFIEDDTTGLKNWLNPKNFSLYEAFQTLFKNNSTIKLRRLFVCYIEISEEQKEKIVKQQKEIGFECKFISHQEWYAAKNSVETFVEAQYLLCLFEDNLGIYMEYLNNNHTGIIEFNVEKVNNTRCSFNALWGRDG